MFVAKVTGTIVATIKAPVFEGRKLLIVEPLSAEGVLQDRYLIAADTVQAGAGDTVLVLDEGNSARQVVQMDPAPIRTVIVGIVDHVDVSTPQALAQPVITTAPDPRGV